MAQKIPTRPRPLNEGVSKGNTKKPPRTARQAPPPPPPRSPRNAPPSR